MNHTVPWILVSIAAILTAVANPSEFVRDKEEFRHGTYDRFWKPKTVYVDRDGSLLFPFGDDLVVAGKGNDLGKQLIEGFLTAYQDKLREKLELRVYIHPDASWNRIHEFVTWITGQKIGKLSLRVAPLRKVEAEKKRKIPAEQVEDPNRDGAPSE